jgi:hypothetical protein
MTNKLGGFAKYAKPQAQQAPIDPSQAVKKVCPCGHDIFEKVCRLGIISKLAPGNRTGGDVNVEYWTYLCKSCGAELVKE